VDRDISRQHRQLLSLPKALRSPRWNDSADLQEAPAGHVVCRRMAEAVIAQRAGW